jgi:hypothetical protein
MDRQRKLIAQEAANAGVRKLQVRNIENEAKNKEINASNIKNADGIAQNVKYLESIAESLNVTLEQLYAFFGKTPDGKTAYNSQDVLGMILQHEIAFEGLDCIIIEASFKYERVAVELTCSLIKPSIWEILSKKLKKLKYESPLSGKEEIIELSPDSVNKMLTGFKGLSKKDQYKSLCAIRLRFRIQDSHNDEKTLFKLGFKLFGTGAKIELKGVEEAGSEGIVDLHTVWFNNGVLIDNKLGSAQLYEDGVPQVALFCQ